MRLISISIAFLLMVSGGRFAAAITLEVRIDGVEGEALANIQAYVEIVKKKQAPKLNTRWIRRMHSRAPDQIRGALQPFGFFSVHVESSLTQRASHWLAEYRVTPGPKTRVREVRLHVSGPGADEPKIKEAQAAFPVKPGDILDSEAYERGRDQLLELVNRLGYAKAKMPVRQVRVNPSLNEATIRLTIETGPKHRFGELTFKQDVVDADFLDRFVDVEPGDRYSQEELLHLQSDLIRTQYFSVVDVRPDLEGAEDSRVPVEVENGACRAP